MSKSVRPLRGASLLLSGSLALSLAGCAVGPDYHSPALAEPAAYHNAPDLAARQATRAAPTLDSWWQGFDDPVLSRLIGRALAQNLDLKAALARVAQARAAADEAGAQRLPEASLGADALREHQSLQSPLGKIASAFPGYSRNQSLYDIGAGASWEADLFGGLKRQAEAADAEAQAAEADRLGLRVSIAAEVADAYFRVRAAQQRIALAEAQTRTDARLLNLVQLRLAGGLATRREQAQAEALLAQTRASLPPLTIEREVQLNRLDVLMGATPGSYASELARSVERYTVPAIAASRGPAELLRRRPDVIAAERRLAASNARIGAATAQYYPQLTLSALLGFVSLGSGQLLTAAALQPQAAAGLRWRLFDFGRVDAEVASAKGGEAEALARYRQSMLRATEDVENAIVTLTQLEAQDGELKAQVAAQTQARDTSEEAYRGGAVSLFEVLDEERRLLAARDQQAQVRAADARAAVATFRALGGGW
ncbi:efflux transporter outer membrane subunit [Crenobacter sp. SG2305]|uniref:efflux transporter outer membrane subunit n=1 Tax=Crenobacter oryzisoli TaxID=3056844 RepID=UPI0025AAAC89|nr:efflux transporter outer membrane subunit [Crenobacter sp. SG2305]MDN0083150.1 efflux transporter outer membrane subunit [Crenobacter sp. SG2305]